MPTPSEKLAFAKRLELALTRCPKKISTPTELALQFNLRHTNSPITPQSAHKWLSGKSIPTADKLETLATWLNVSTLWLRHGVSELFSPQPVPPVSSPSATNHDASSREEVQLLTRYRNLNEHRRKLIKEIVEQFSLDQESSRNL